MLKSFFRKNKEKENVTEVLNPNMYIGLPGVFAMTQKEDFERGFADKLKYNYFLEIGKKLIYSERLDVWNSLINIMSVLHYKSVEEALQIMLNIENHGIEYAAHHVNDFSQFSLELVLNFSKKGPEFFDLFKDVLKTYKRKNNGFSYVSGRAIEKEILGKVNKLKLLNNKFSEKTETLSAPNVIEINA